MNRAAVMGWLLAGIIGSVGLGGCASSPPSSFYTLSPLPAADGRGSLSGGGIGVGLGPVSFPVLMDTQGDALQRWGIYAFPTTLVLDREHRVRYAVFGAFDWSSQEVLDTLSPLLAQDSHAAADRDPR